MFSQLKEDYRKQIIRLWRAYVHDRVMVIDLCDEPTTVLVEDPHEARFIADTISPGATPELAISSNVPADGESGYCTFHIRDFHDSNVWDKQGQKYSGFNE